MPTATNPFSLSFGKRPGEYISRIEQTSEIIDDFQAESSPNQIYMITGVRGSGKTVFLANIETALAADDNWIVTDLSTATDMLTSLAARLYNSRMRLRFEKARIDLSFLGIGISFDGSEKITSTETAIEKMLGELQKENKRLLIAVDEAVNNDFMRVFASVFQIFVRKDYPVYLLMTGLYENIYNLQNEKNLTFLYRAPKITLTPLNSGAVIRSYESVFRIPATKAKEMALITGGYPFAFQVLGYLCWKNGGADALPEVLPSFDQYLDEYVYSKIWSELSVIDKRITHVMAESDLQDVTAIRKKLDMKTQEFSVYRKRLLNKGVVLSPSRGTLKFALPRFNIFVNLQLD